MVAQSGSNVVWESNTGGKGVSSMGMMDLGNLVLKGKDGSTIWQSFSYPKDSLYEAHEIWVQQLELGPQDEAR